MSEFECEGIYYSAIDILGKEVYKVTNQFFLSDEVSTLCIVYDLDEFDQPSMKKVNLPSRVQSSGSRRIETTRMVGCHHSKGGEVSYHRGWNT